MSPRAEVERIWSRGGKVEVTGFVHGDDEGEAPKTSLLVLRDHDEVTLGRDTEVDGRYFSVTYSTDEIARASIDGPGTDGPACWDLYLVATVDGEEERLRVGRHLDDVQDKRRIMVFPGQSVAGQERSVLVKPRYTVENNLSIDCSPQETAS